jgi:hypothetical protein
VTLLSTTDAPSVMPSFFIIQDGTYAIPAGAVNSNTPA